MNWLGLILLLAVGSAVLLRGWRWLDQRLESRSWLALASAARCGHAPGHAVFDPACLEGLPEPAQRYFRYTIGPGTRLKQTVELAMEGELGLGTQSKPNYRPMAARQLLAPPHGLVWKLRSGLIAGSDGVTSAMSWTRFWLLGIVPVVRAGHNEDHRRSAFGRVVAEGAFWVPASLLPGDSVTWQSVDASTARAIVTFGGLEQAVDITVAQDGRPTRVLIQRWSSENSAKTYREQPFGGFLSEFREFEGYRLPTVVEGGNQIGTSEYFPFYKAKITAVRFLQDADEP